MRKYQKALSLVMAILMLVGMFPLALFADTVTVISDGNEVTEGLQFQIVSGAAYVVGYNGKDKVVTIPSTYQGAPIVGIDQGVFSEASNVIGVIIESEHITELISGEFSGCTSLEYVVVPASVTDIMGITMWDGTVIPEVRYAGSEGMLSYDELEVAEIVYNYKPHKHSYVPSVIPPACTEIGYTSYTCSVCGEGYKVDVTSPIGHSYSGSSDTECNRCGEIRESETLIAEGKCGVSVNWKLREDGTLVIYGNGAMEDYFEVSAQPWNKYLSRIKNLIVEEGVVFIGRAAFYGHVSIKTVSLPESLMAIEEYAFFGCSGVTALTVPEKVFYIGQYALRKTGLTSIDFENQNGWAFVDGTTVDFSNVSGVVNALRKTEATYKQSFLRTFEGDGNAIAGGKFGNNNEFNWVLSDTGVLTVNGTGNMPRFNVNTTPWYGYRGALRTVIIGEGITSVGRCSFHTCRAIVSISLPESLKTISEYAFYNCPYVTSVKIPEGVTRIEIFAFRKCKILTDAEFGIYYGWSVGGTKISATELSFTSAEALTKMYYSKIWVRDVNAEPEVIDPNYVAGGACNSYTKWQLVWIDSAKTKMKLTVSGNGIMPSYGVGNTPWYSYVNNITEIVVEAGVTDIGRCAFYGLKNVTAVTISDGVKTVGEFAFNSCSALTELYIPASVEKIGAQALAKSGVTSLVFAKCAGWTLSDGTMIDAVEMSDAFLAAEYIKDVFRSFSMTRDTSVPEELPEYGWYAGKFYIDGKCVVSTEMWIGADYYSFDEEGNSTKITKDDGFTGNY